jgi:hypothetical protein
MEEIERRREEGRRRRAALPKIVWFKGIYQDLRGNPRSFYYGVSVTERLLRNGSAMYFLVHSTIRRMKFDGKMPIHRRGQVFRDFVYGLYSADWEKIDTLLEYDVDVPT